MVRVLSPETVVAPALRFTWAPRQCGSARIRETAPCPDAVIRTNRTPSDLEVPVKSGETAGRLLIQAAARVHMPSNRRRARSGEA